MAEKSRRLRARTRLRRSRRQPDMGQRNWAELPHDVLSLIFQKLGAFEVLWTAQAVCRPWRQLSLEPQIWRSIDMRRHAYLFNMVGMEEPAREAVRRSGGLIEGFYEEDFGSDELSHADLFDMVDMEELAREAVRRSGGLIEGFYAEDFGSNELLRHIADRTTGLRCLVLISPVDISEEGLLEFVSRCPLLEELQITNCWFFEEAVGAIGRACPELKRFRMNKSNFDGDEDDREALEIANNMHQLRELQLIGNPITYKGLEAILDKCSRLESLDIRACINVNVDAGLSEKLARIKSVRLPHDSTSDYEYETGYDVDSDFSYFSMSSD